MLPKLAMITVVSIAPIAALSALLGCEEKKPAANSAAPATPAKSDDHGHAHAEDGSHTPAPAAPSGHTGAVISLGDQAIGAFAAKATRDATQIVAGKDAPIDVIITPAAGATTKPAAVRFWIGTQDAKGSVKAKALVEDPKDPDRWHVHVEIPNPLPQGSRLWVEIEDDKGGTAAGSYDLKM